MIYLWPIINAETQNKRSLKTSQQWQPQQHKPQKQFAQN